MKLFNNMVMLELQKDEWIAEKGKKKIITPETVADREDGKFMEKIPWHFFKVIFKGPDCRKVEIGDRVFPRAPDLNHQPQMIPIVLWQNGEKVVYYEISEDNLGGIE
jgi:hypothetical protein